MPLIKCEISFQLKWSEDCFLVTGNGANQVPEIKITDTKLYVPVITLSTQDNIKLLKLQIIGKNINLKKQIKRKTDIYIF